MLLPAAGLENEAAALHLLLPPSIDSILAAKEFVSLMETTKAVEQLEPPYSQATASAAGLGTSMALPWPESWTAVSCAISGSGEILVIEHTVQGVTAERARCLATIAAGKRVGIQRLTQEEARDRYGARADQLIGCTITGLVLRQRQPTACKGMDRDAGKRATPGPTIVGENALVVFARSEENLSQLFEALQPWINNELHDMPASKLSDPIVAAVSQPEVAASQASIQKHDVGGAARTPADSYNTTATPPMTEMLQWASSFPLSMRQSAETDLQRCIPVSKGV